MKYVAILTRNEDGSRLSIDLGDFSDDQQALAHVYEKMRYGPDIVDILACRSLGYVKWSGKMENPPIPAR